MSKPIILMCIAVACIGISVFGEKGTHGKRISSVFRRASDLSFVFYFGLIAMHFESLVLGIGVVVMIVYSAARNWWDDLFREGFRRILRYVFRRNAPSNPQK